MNKIKLFFTTVILATGLMVVPAIESSAGTIPCSYGNYFDSNGNRIKDAPVEKVGSQKGKAWCVGYRAFFYVSPWYIVQRDYELTTGR